MKLSMELASIAFPYVQPGSSIPVVDARMQASSPVLTLKHPGSHRLMDCQVSNILQSSQRIYLVLLVEDNFADPPKSSYAIVRYDDAEQISTIDFEEFQPLSTQASLSQDQAKLAQSFCSLFNYPQDPSTQILHNELREELTSEIYFGGSGQALPGGTMLLLARKERYGDSVWFEFSAEQEQNNARFMLLFIRTVRSESYCILIYPPEDTAEDPVARKIVLQFCDADTLKVLEPDQLLNIRCSLVKLLAAGARKDSVAEVEKVFGVLARP